MLNPDSIWFEVLNTVKSFGLSRLLCRVLEKTSRRKIVDKAEELHIEPAAG